MRPVWWPALLSLVLACSVASAESWQGRVVKVLDGDSLRIAGAEGVREVRLYGIDAPEYGQAGGEQAKRFLKRHALGKNAMVMPLDVDRYGRVVATVMIGEKTLNLEMVSSGWAWVYRRYCEQPDLCGHLVALEDAARRTGLGIWRNPHPLPPWQWKRRRH